MEDNYLDLDLDYWTAAETKGLHFYLGCIHGTLRAHNATSAATAFIDPYQVHNRACENVLGTNYMELHLDHCTAVPKGVSCIPEWRP